MESGGGRFASLSEPLFRRLLIGGTFTFLSMQGSTIARGWLAFELTGTNTALGGVLIGFGLSSLVAIPTGGVIADRFPKRRVLIAASTVQTLISLSLALAVTTGVIAYWMLIVASVVQGAMISLLGPARLAMLSEAVPPERMTNAILLSQSSLQFTRVFGPAAAGVLIGVSAVGVDGVYYLTAVSAALGLVATWGLPEGASRITHRRSPIEDLLDGVRFVRSNRRLAHLLLLSFAVVLMGFPHVAFLPTLAEDIFDAGSSGFGLLNTGAAIGALVVTLGLAGVAASRLWKIQAVSAIAFGVFLVGFALAPTFPVALLVMMLVGGSAAAFQGLNNSLALKLAPVEYHGRVQSLLMLSFTGFGLAALPLGILADAIGLRQTMSGMGAAVAAVSIASMIIARRRDKNPVEVLEL